MSDVNLTDTERALLADFLAGTEATDWPDTVAANIATSDWLRVVVDARVAAALAPIQALADAWKREAVFLTGRTRSAMLVCADEVETALAAAGVDAAPNETTTEVPERVVLAAAAALYGEERNASMGFDARPDWPDLDDETRGAYIHIAREVCGCSCSRCSRARLRWNCVHGSSSSDASAVGSAYDRAAVPSDAAPNETTTEDEDPWCREESCTWRHWTSGAMPTHRRGADCPPRTAVPSGHEQEGDGR